MKKEQPIQKSRYDYQCSDGYEEALKLAPYLGKIVKSGFKSDKGTPQYLLGLDSVEGIEGYSRNWIAKIRFWCHGRLEEKWINVKSVEIINKN
jgi:hypothetical protein